MHNRNTSSHLRLLFVCILYLVVAALPLRFAMADEGTESQEPALEVTVLDIAYEAENSTADGETDDASTSALDTAESGEQTAADSGQTAVVSDAEPALEPLSSTTLDFVYIDSDTVEVGQTEYIAAAVPEGLPELVSAQLTLVDEAGNKLQLEASEIVDGAVLFELTNDGSAPGTYNVDSVSFTFAEGAELTYSMSSLGLEASFAFLSASLELLDTIEETIEGVEVSAELLGDAESADAEPALSAMASSKPIIALDPGHGGNDSGAVGNGVVERDCTWKITMACKEELERLGAQVVVVVNESEFKNTTLEAVSLADRVNRANAAGAAVLVSMHINSAAATAQGCMVLIPSNSAYNQYTYSDGVALSNEVRTRLTALGLKNNGNLIKTYEDKYPDGKSSCDYYGIVRRARLAGMLGVIIEHAFLSNAEDAAKLKQDSFLTQLGVADAQAIYERYYNQKAGITGIDVSSTSVPVGTKVTFSPRLVGDTSGVKFNYVWRLGSGWSTWDSYKKSHNNEYTTATSYSFTPTKAGTYHLTIDYVAADGTITYVSTDIEVTESTDFDVAAVVASNYNPSVGERITFKPYTTGDVSGAEYNYVWRRIEDGWNFWGSTKKNTGNYTSSKSDTFTPTKAGTYSLSVDVIKGGVKKTASVTITVKEKSSSSSSSNSSGSTSTSSAWNVTGVTPSATSVTTFTKVTFKPVTTGNVSGATYNYVWRRVESGWKLWNSTKKETGSYTSATSGSFTPTEAGTYSLSIDVSKGGTTKTVTTQITVTDKWTLTGIKVSPSGTYYVGDRISFKPVTTGTVTNVEYNYVWRRVEDGWNFWGSTKKNTGKYTSSASDTFTPTKAGTYSLSIDVMEGGVKKTVSTTITVLAKSTSSSWDVTSVKVSASSVRKGTQITFSPVTTGDVSGAEYNYVWRYVPSGWSDWGSTKKNTGSYTSSKSDTFTPTKAGTYALSIDVIKDGVKKTVSTTITATERTWSVSGVTVSAPSIHYGESVTYSPVVSNSTGAKLRYNYVWRWTGNNDWSYWGSTLKDSGSYTTATSRTIDKSILSNKYPGVYTLSIDVVEVDSKGTVIDKITVSSTVTLFTTKTPIMGTTRMSGTVAQAKAKLVADLNAGIKNRGGSYPASTYKNKDSKLDASTPEKFIDILWEEAVAEGVRPEVLYAQIMLETGYLQFGGDVKVTQYNFGGIGATGNGNPGNSFANVREGLRASTQHLKAYASTDALVNNVVDPRFTYVKRGVSPTVEKLTGRWAASATYANNILAIMKQLGL